MRWGHEIYTGFFVLIAAGEIIAFFITGNWHYLGIAAVFGMIAFAVYEV